MFVVVVYEGVMNINSGDTSLMLGVLSPQDVLNAQRVPGVSYKRQSDVYGGNFWTSLRQALSGAHKFVKDNKLISRGLSLIKHPAAIPAAEAARMLGYGRHRRMRGGELQDLEGGDLYDETESEDNSSENLSDNSEEVEIKVKKPINKQSVIKRLTSKRINNASDLAEDY